MWHRFEGKARSRAESLAYLNTLHWTEWDPQGITLHNTAMPTLQMWAESGPSHDARIRNLQNYYEEELGWHAGPHFFVSRNWINWFSNPLKPGVHSRCWNATRFGIEMVGDFDTEAFDTGDGAKVRDNALWLMAALNNHFEWNAGDFVFHKQCARDNHDCPGIKGRNRSDITRRIQVFMDELKAVPVHPIEIGNLQTSITMSEFAAPEDAESDRLGAYLGGKLIDWTKPGVALPFHFLIKPLPKVLVYANGKSVLCELVDVGPWTSKVGADPYWSTHTRPKAEFNHRTNGAGIDATPAVFDALGYTGKRNTRKIKVDWTFA